MADYGGMSENDLMEARKRTLEEIKKRGGKGGAPGYTKRLAEIDNALSGLRKSAGVQGPPTDTRQPITQNPTGPTERTTPVNQAISETPAGPVDSTLGVNKKTGAIDPSQAVPTISGENAADINRTFQMQNPGSQTDIYGNTQNITRDPNTGEIAINQQGGAAATGANAAFLSGLTDFSQNGQSARTQAQDAAYGYISQNYASDEAREVEQERQRLAEQGIGEGQDVYGIAMDRIDRKYRNLEDQARNQGILAGNSIYSTNVGALGTLSGVQQQQKPTFTAYQGGTSNQADVLMQLLSTMSIADLQRYGIDKETAARIQAATIAARSSGSSSSDEGFIIGGAAP